MDLSQDYQIFLSKNLALDIKRQPNSSMGPESVVLSKSQVHFYVGSLRNKEETKQPKKQSSGLTKGHKTLKATEEKQEGEDSYCVYSDLMIRLTNRPQNKSVTRNNHSLGNLREVSYVKLLITTFDKC